LKRSKSSTKRSGANRPAKKKAAKNPHGSHRGLADAAADGYEKKKQSENAKQREAATDVREIGAIPACKNPKRKAACERDFNAFLKTYFPEDTRHPWSKVHLKLISLIETVVLIGSLLAIGIPRGWGKTFMSVRAIIWACAYRHHTMCMLIAASDDAAKELLQDVRDELETNPLLMEDFPELCLPIKALDGINQRAKSQLCDGKRTRVKAADFELHLGDVCGQHGCVIFAGGITGSRIRGKRKKRGGRIERPTLGLCDDFQTRNSARSRLQCETRLKIVQDDMPGLPGNDQTWSCLLTCTVIEPGDAADQLLDRSQHPTWRAIRQAFLESLPDADALELWDEWNKIREEDLIADCQQAVSDRAHQFYLDNFDAMNSGAVVAWEYAYDPETFVDALEKAMEWYFRSRRGFWSELQNQPDKFEASTLPQLAAIILCKRWSAYPQHKIPEAAEHLTCHADVSKAVLWYELRAWALDSTSWTIDYGTWPNQGRQYFTQSSAKKTIDNTYSDLPDWATRCKAAIRDLFARLFDQDFEREDGGILRLSIGGIDANDFTATVKDAIRLAGLRGKLWPMHSRSFRNRMPLNEERKRDGDVIGDNWRKRQPATGNMRYITYDTDLWKTHHRDRLLMPPESPGSLTWFKNREHRMLADHHTAERSEMVHYEKQNRWIEQWTEIPNQDNHLWDVGVGNDVLGNVLGLKLPAADLLGVEARPTKPKRKRRKARVSI
jgi:hypothetical protein